MRGIRALKDGQTDALVLIQNKGDEYFRNAMWYRFLYYAFRVIAGLSAALLPFIVVSQKAPELSVALSIVIAVVTVLDTVFNPKDRWVLFSKASDVISIAQLKLEGHYDKYKEALDIIVATEDAAVQQVIGLKELLDRVKEVTGSLPGGATPTSDPAATPKSGHESSTRPPSS